MIPTPMVLVWFPLGIAMIVIFPEIVNFIPNLLF